MYKTKVLFDQHPLYAETAVVHSRVIDFIQSELPPKSAVIAGFETSLYRNICQISASRLLKDKGLNTQNQAMFLYEMMRRGQYFGLPLVISKNIAVRFARNLAISLHCYLLQASWGTTSTHDSAEFPSLASLEMKYRSLLMKLQRGCLQGSPEVIWGAGAKSIALIHDCIAPQLHPSRRVDGAGGDSSSLSLMELGRRLIACVAAVVLLLQRMGTGPGKAGLAGIALRRSRSFRLGKGGSSTAPRSSETDTNLVFGKVVSVDFQRLDSVSYGTVYLDALEEPLVLWQRSLVMRGVGKGSLLMALARHDDAGLLKIEAEGPTATARDVFEDWLAVEVRDAYDLYPGSIAAIWSFPELGASYRDLELHARLKSI